MKGQFQIYKLTGALQASLITYDQTDHKTGAVYLEAAKCVDKNNRSYDWKTKVKFALGASDLFTIFEVIDSGNPEEIKLYHVPAGSAGTRGAKGKRLSMKPGTDKYEGTWMWTLEDQISESKVMVPLSRGEFRVFIELCRSAMPIIFGWDFAGSYDTAYQLRALIEENNGD